MTGSSIAGIITASATVLIAIGGVITAVSVLLPILAGTRKNTEQIADVHKIVNQDKTDRDNFNRALIRALEDRGIPVPVDQSLPPTPGEHPAP